MTASGQRNDPIPAFNFLVKIGSEISGGFSDCSGFDYSMTTQDFPEGGVNNRLVKLPGPISQTNITLKRGVVDGKLWQWYTKILGGNIEKQSVIVEVQGEDQSTAMTINLYGAYPVKWSGPTLAGSASQLAVETLELAHAGFDISGPMMGAS